MMNKEGIISFDPNVRLNLWYSKSKCRDTILNFIPKANILKVSSDELEFITGIKSEQEGLNSLFKGRSEEHTSELQSRQYLVCRLLLEKKKKYHLHTLY